MLTTNEILHRAKAAKAQMCSVVQQDIDEALAKIADAIVENRESILSANALDVKASREKLGDVMIDRLLLTDARIASMADGIRKVITLPSLTGSILETHTAESGILINKVCVPLGVLAVIYESRPNVTADAAALAIKSGNAVILRSGKEAHRSASAIVEAIRSALLKTKLPQDAVQLIEDTSRTFDSSVSFKEILYLIPCRSTRRTPRKASALERRNSRSEPLALHEVLRFEIADGETGVEQIPATRRIHNLLDLKRRTLHEVLAVKAH